jgi:hypothetical protein
MQEIKTLYDRIEYYKDGKLHRDDDLPAMEYNNGDKFWCQNGQLHRINNPAAEYANGINWWCQYGKYHRLDGPAVEGLNGYKAWYIENIKYTEEEFNKKIQELCQIKTVK